MSRKARTKISEDRDADAVIRWIEASSPAEIAQILTQIDEKKSAMVCLKIGELLKVQVDQSLDKISRDFETDPASILFRGLMGGLESLRKK